MIVIHLLLISTTCTNYYTCQIVKYYQHKTFNKKVFSVQMSWICWYFHTYLESNQSLIMQNMLFRMILNTMQFIILWFSRMVNIALYTLNKLCYNELLVIMNIYEAETEEGSNTPLYMNKIYFRTISAIQHFSCN